MAKHTLKFYPLGNADTSLILLNNGKRILWDYANVKDESDDDDKRCNLALELDQEVKDYYDVVTFTHADSDHISGFSEYFYLHHAKKYQNDERKKINELWVPASVLLDTQAEDEAKILKTEARHRLKNKTGILVFSRPKMMKKWCDDQKDISYDEVKHLFIDAGMIVPTFSLTDDGVEFFVHSPFQSESQKMDRNKASIVVQAQFDDKCESKLILGADCLWDIWKDIVNITKYFKKIKRLEWDIFRISHHCSYLSLNEDKGEDRTDPIEEIKWLFEDLGHEKSRLISSSKPIPKEGSDEDNKQPPHRQAYAYYKDVVLENDGEIKVTMEEPSIEEPKPTVIEIDKANCAKLVKGVAAVSIIIGDKKPPRAG